MKGGNCQDDRSNTRYSDVGSFDGIGRHWRVFCLHLCFGLFDFERGLLRGEVANVDGWEAKEEEERRKVYGIDRGWRSVVVDG